MSKDFVTIDVRKKEYEIIRGAFEAWEIEGYFHVDTEKKYDREDIKQVLFKLGFGDMVDDGK